eukprot:IDg548t1
MRILRSSCIPGYTEAIFRKLLRRTPDEATDASVSGGLESATKAENMSDSESSTPRKLRCFSTPFERMRLAHQSRRTARRNRAHRSVSATLEALLVQSGTEDSEKKVDKCKPSVPSSNVSFEEPRNPAYSGDLKSVRVSKNQNRISALRASNTLRITSADSVEKPCADDLEIPELDIRSLSSCRLSFSFYSNLKLEKAADENISNHPT